jgi:hypothetical protein
LSTVKLEAIKEAQEFAAKQGKVAVPLAMNGTARGEGSAWPTAEYQFRVVDKTDSEAGRAFLSSAPQVIVNVDSQPSTHLQPVEAVPPSQRLAELQKMFDAKLITPEEFAMKRKAIIDGL